MKNRLLLPTALLLLATPALQAEHLTPQQALSRLQSSEAAPSLVRHATALVGKNAPALTATIGQLYIFTATRSFMILPADDRAPALLGYSDTQAYDPANPGLNYWLDFYNRQLQSLSSQPAIAASHPGRGAACRAHRADSQAAKSSVQAGVACDANNPSQKSPRKAEKKEILPLIQTLWNQEAPYNDLCPKVDGHETVTGCVATAMAQVMKYHNHPSQGTGSHSYYWAPGKDTLRMDSSSQKFEWDLMTDRYDSESTEAQRLAVASLMLACGISVDMHYDIGDSGAATVRMGGALMDYFGYDKALWMPMRDFYGIYEWEDMIYSDLEQGLPVLYSGVGTAGGHQFICDGYRDDGYFHFNWGWGGMSNGYFLLDALNPADLGVGGGAGGFNSGQQITLGVRPAVEGSTPVYMMYCTGDFKAAETSIKVGDDLRCTGGFFNYGLTRLPDGSHLGMKFVSSADDKDVRFERGYSVAGLGGLDGYGDDVVKFPDLPDGQYVVTPALYDGSKWETVRVELGHVQCVLADVKDGEVTLTAPAFGGIAVDGISVPDVIYAGRDLPLHFDVLNKDDVEYLGNVTPCLLDADRKLVAKSQYRPVDVLADASEKVDDYIANFKAVEGAELTAGQYTLVFRDAGGQDISTPVSVMVKVVEGEAEIKFSDFRIDGPDPVTDKDAVKFAYTLECTSGYFTDDIYILFFPGDGGGDLKEARSQMYYLIEGETIHGEITADLSGFDNGTYIAIMYHAGHEISDYLYFHIDQQTGLTTLQGDHAPAPAYTIDGLPAPDPDAPGLYIIQGQKRLR